MSGTIIVNSNKSFDVRTIDFVRIANTLRSYAAQSPTASKLLETVDEFGMNMICADELDAADFTNFAKLMSDVRAVLGEKDKELADFLELVCASIEADTRLRH